MPRLEPIADERGGREHGNTDDGTEGDAREEQIKVRGRGAADDHRRSPEENGDSEEAGARDAVHQSAEKEGGERRRGRREGDEEAELRFIDLKPILENPRHVANRAAVGGVGRARGRT